MILSLPIGIYGSFQFLDVMGLSNDVYAQIASAMLVGLSARTLTSSSNSRCKAPGWRLMEAAIEGGKPGFRLISIDSVAFIAGLLPLVVASGLGLSETAPSAPPRKCGSCSWQLQPVMVIPGLYYIFGKIGALPQGPGGYASQ